MLRKSVGDVEMGMLCVGEGAMHATKPEDRARVLNRAARERALIEAAAKLFSEKGYEATTTREIAAAAGCAEGLISRYFKGKAGLLRALIHVHFSEEVDEFHDDSPPAASLGEEIARRILWDVQHIDADHEFLRVIIPQLLLQPNLGAEVRDVGPGRHEKLIMQRLQAHPRFAALPPEEQEATVLLVHGIAFVFGFWNPAITKDRVLAKRQAMTVAKILARAF